MTNRSQRNNPKRPRALFICGSINQTTQMHQVAAALPEFEAIFTPYYSDHWLMVVLRDLRLQEFSIAGHKARRRCLAYLHSQNLRVDIDGKAGGYDLVVTSTDQIMPRNIRDKPTVVVQEGILDLPNVFTGLCKRFAVIPRWLGGTALTALSLQYDRFCAASEGYRDFFVSQGADPERVVVTGSPNFDNCERYYQNDFPHRGYVLVCTSDTRETFKRDNRRAFVERALGIAGGRQLIFKLHPNENVKRSTAEIKRHAPRALVYSSGSAEEMVANCQELITQWSSLVFIGMALGKTVHTYFDLDQLRKLVPVQNNCAARNIAGVCREVFEQRWGWCPPRLALAPDTVDAEVAG